ncbi:uncharacterized protein C8Q71DRAFT_716073 [Rhodofomes roseus]|uniref:HNH nuclease domain-containing protein n=1 Tax=Rhodofomes roseus TaxID=34475 RepID=A0ABQ8K2C4_9APHY|nr:uncharacterized protein C8Q71DRAFT_716073 [Rhodofomes roseus]KAH9830891.1 hypothetical protein C8Q71DRAFT_716073 [Rhodofomes roseus]
MPTGTTPQCVRIATPVGADAPDEVRPRCPGRVTFTDSISVGPYCHYRHAQHYCEVDQASIKDNEILDGPANTLVMNTLAHYAFDSFTWCLQPTETLICYVIKTYHTVLKQAGARHISKHVTFHDHSGDFPRPIAVDTPGTRPSLPGHSGRSDTRVDLPNTPLLRLHAALTSVLRMSGAAEVFDIVLKARSQSNEPVAPYASGSTFWQSVVAYDGSEVCLEAELYD